MRQILRYGIEIDVCPTSDGIWLDKGELEKLMVLLQEESMNDLPGPKRYGQRMSQTHGRYDRDDDDDDHYGRGQKKKRKISRMMDVFDF